MHTRCVAVRMQTALHTQTETRVHNVHRRTPHRVQSLKQNQRVRLEINQVARHVRWKIFTAGWNLLGALVREKHGDTWQGEHDMVLDRMSAEEGPTGLVSCELKCRRLRVASASASFFAKLRRELREEQVSACTWWQRAVARRPGAWKGRMVVLMVCDGAGSRFLDSRAEWMSVAGSRQTAWGWEEEARPLPVVIPQKLPSTATSEKPPFPMYSYVREGGKLVAPVGPLFVLCGRATGNLGRYLGAVKRRHPDLGDNVVRVARSGEEKGGTLQWCGTERLLKRLHKEL